MIELLIVEFSALIIAPCVICFFCCNELEKHFKRKQACIQKPDNKLHWEGGDFLANNAHKSLLQNK